MDIQGKVVIITGASEGIGAATAQLLAKQGAKVALVARSADKLNALAAGIQAAGGEVVVITTDMRQQSQVTEMISQVSKRFGRVDILINNAGQSVGGPVEKLNLDDYRTVLDLNVFGPLYAMQAVIPIMRQQGDGLILNISSMVSKMAIPGIGGYASTKYALNGISMTARAELARDNIRVILVFPRITATNFVANGITYSTGAPRSAPNPAMQIDSAEHVADKILAAIQTEPAEQYME